MKKSNQNMKAVSLYKMLVATGQVRLDVLKSSNFLTKKIHRRIGTQKVDSSKNKLHYKIKKAPH